MQAISKLFRVLRKHGIFAKRRIADCCSCAGGLVPEGTPYVITTTQGDLKDRPNSRTFYFQRDRRNVTVYYGRGSSGPSTDATSEETKRIGQLVKQEAKKLGIPVTWNGDPEESIVLRRED